MSKLNNDNQKISNLFHELRSNYTANSVKFKLSQFNSKELNYLLSNFELIKIYCYGLLSSYED